MNNLVARTLSFRRAKTQVKLVKTPPPMAVVPGVMICMALVGLVFVTFIALSVLGIYLAFWAR